MRIHRLRSALKPGQDFCQASCQKPCPNGHKETESCLSISASHSLHSYIKSRILPPITSPPSARMCKEKRSGDFSLFPPANFANSAILPTAKISTFFMQNFLPRKPKDSSLLCPNPTGENIDREQAVPRPKVSEFRPKNNIIEFRLGLHIKSKL